MIIRIFWKGPPKESGKSAQIAGQTRKSFLNKSYTFKVMGKTTKLPSSASTSTKSLAEVSLILGIIFPPPHPPLTEKVF